MPTAPDTVLHRCTHLATGWCPDGVTGPLTTAIRSRRVIPVTSTFVASVNKDAKYFQDLRAGEVLIVDYIPAGDARGFAAQAAVYLLAVDYAGRMAAKGMTSAECLRLIKAADVDTTVMTPGQARHACLASGLDQSPVELAPGHARLFAGANAWLSTVFEMLVSRYTPPDKGGGVALDPRTISLTGWFEAEPTHKRHAPPGTQPLITSFGVVTPGSAASALSPNRDAPSPSVLPALMGPAPAVRPSPKPPSGPPPPGHPRSGPVRSPSASPPAAAPSAELPVVSLDSLVARVSPTALVSPPASDASHRSGDRSDSSSEMSDSTRIAVADLVGATLCTARLARALVHSGTTLAALQDPRVPLDAEAIIADAPRRLAGMEQHSVRVMVEAQLAARRGAALFAAHSPPHLADAARAVEAEVFSLSPY